MESSEDELEGAYLTESSDEMDGLKRVRRVAHKKMIVSI
jgi:hypothetical protein